MTHPLEDRLRDAGIACRVERRDRLAILIPDNAAMDFGRESRLQALQMAREEGFSHVSVELDPDGAPLPRT